MPQLRRSPQIPTPGGPCADQYPFQCPVLNGRYCCTQKLTCPSGERVIEKNDRYCMDTLATASSSSAPSSTPSSSSPSSSTPSSSVIPTASAPPLPLQTNPPPLPPPSNLPKIIGPTAAVLFLLSIAIAFFWWWKLRSRKVEIPELEGAKYVPELHSTAKERIVYELDGQVCYVDGSSASGGTTLAGSPGRSEGDSRASASSVGDSGAGVAVEEVEAVGLGSTDGSERQSGQRGQPL